MIPYLVPSLYDTPQLTIDPRLLEWPPPQHNMPQNFLYIPKEGYQQDQSSAPLTSISASASYPGDELSESVLSPFSLAVDNIGSTNCICGCDCEPCVPQREFIIQGQPLSQNYQEEIIPFSVNGKCGYSLRAALRKEYVGLDGRDDRLFFNQKSSISLRVEWLPYERWTRQIRTLDWRKPPTNITRQKLATEIAKKMDIFFKEMQDREPDPSYRQYSVQHGAIDLDHVELVALKRVSKASYMPHFRLITPPIPQRPLL